MGIKNPKWIFITKHGQICRPFDIQALWGQRIYRVWLPIQDSIVRVRSYQSKTIGETVQLLNHHYISYLGEATRVADAPTHDIPLDPVESSIISLPHQIQALSSAVFNGRVRYLLANPVGLGKTSSPSSLCGNSGCTGYR